MIFKKVYQYICSVCEKKRFTTKEELINGATPPRVSQM